jgi:hypothetical protein
MIGQAMSRADYVGRRFGHQNLEDAYPDSDLELPVKLAVSRRKMFDTSIE